MENVSIQLFRSASAGFSIGGRSFAANASSLVRNQMADSASTIPSVSVMGGGALRSSDAMNKILDIVGNMGKSRRHHHHHHNHHGKHQENVAVQRRAFNMYINKGPDSISTLSVRVGHHGFDVAKGSDGNDTIAYANSSNDYIITQIRGGGGDDVISLSSTAYGPQVAFGGAGNDTIVVSARTAFAFGGEGDDVLIGGTGVTNFDGGEGTDTANFSHQTQGVTASLATGGANGDTFTGVENIVGTDFDDHLTGDDSDNVLDGGLGTDTLIGGGGDDLLLGGGGADAYDGGAGTDTVSYASAQASVSVDLSSGGSAGAAAGDTYQSIENVVGSDFADTLTGDGSDNVLSGGDGDDTFLITGSDSFCTQCSRRSTRRVARNAPPNARFRIRPCSR